MKKDKLIQEFEGLEIENANRFVGGACAHPTESRRYEKTYGPNGPNDWHMDEIVTFYTDPDEGDTLSLKQICTPLN